MSELRQSDESDDLRVELFGTVHLAGCPAIPGMTWAWKGRNSLPIDKPCVSCLPNGLPTPPERPTPSPDDLPRVAGEGGGSLTAVGECSGDGCMGCAGRRSGNVTPGVADA